MLLVTMTQTCLLLSPLVQTLQGQAGSGPDEYLLTKLGWLSPRTVPTSCPLLLNLSSTKDAPVSSCLSKSRGVSSDLLGAVENIQEALSPLCFWEATPPSLSPFP